MVAGVGQTGGVAVVADRQDLAEVDAGDHGADLEPLAGRALGELARQAQVDLLKAGAVGHGRLLVGSGH